MALFAIHRGRLTATRVEHAAWPLQDAEAEIERNTMTAPFGITLPSTPPILQFARRLDTDRASSDDPRAVASPADSGRRRRIPAATISGCRTR